MTSPSVKNTASKLISWVLIGGMTAMAPVSQAAAESYRRSSPSSQTQTYHSQGQRTTVETPRQKPADSSENSWLGLALMGGLIYLMLNDISLDMSGNSGSVDSSRPGLRQDDSQSSNPGSSNPDNGIGCYWGYESMGTCVK